MFRYCLLNEHACKPARPASWRIPLAPAHTWPCTWTTCSTHQATWHHHGVYGPRKSFDSTFRALKLGVLKHFFYFWKQKAVTWCQIWKMWGTPDQLHFTLSQEADCCCWGVGKALSWCSISLHSPVFVQHWFKSLKDFRFTLMYVPVSIGFLFVLKEQRGNGIESSISKQDVATICFPALLFFRILWARIHLETSIYMEDCCFGSGSNW